jgi:citrate synthase
VVVAETSIAWVDPVNGAFIRGYPLADLAERHPYESVAHVVLRGDLPRDASRNEPLANASSWNETIANATLTPDRERLAREIGKALGPELGLVAAFPLAGEDDWWLDPPGTIARILGRIPAVTAAVRGGPMPRVGATYAERALAALGATAADPAALRALEVLLSLEAEHGLSASTYACRVAASSGASPAAALAAATATLTGPRHGGATSEARTLLRDLASASDAKEVVRSRRAKKLVFSGFGHRIYKGADPRLPALRRAIDAMTNVPLRDAALALEQAVTEEFAPKELRANIDLWGAVLLDALGVDPSMYVAAFALGLGSGWLAHYEEQLGEGRLIRPESAYAGSPRREVP